MKRVLRLTQLHSVPSWHDRLPRTLYLEEAAESMRMHFVHHIFHSTPDQTNVREQAYKQLRHLQIFLDTLKGWVETAAARREEMNLP